MARLSSIPEEEEEGELGQSSSLPAPLRYRRRPIAAAPSTTRPLPPLPLPVLARRPGRKMPRQRGVVWALIKKVIIQALFYSFLVWFFLCKLANYRVIDASFLGLSVCVNTEFDYSPITASLPAFLPPENTTYRAPDTIDTFLNYNYRNHSDCQISSLDLHSAFSPLCKTREEFIRAFSSGGRIGFNQPFIPLDCDMRWFTTEEICEIFSRFEKVIVIGDSMMRHVVGALNVLLRKDLGYGAVTNWNFNDQETLDCFCNHQMDVKACSVQGIFSTSSVLEHDPDSLACTQPIDLVIEMMLRFPLDPTEVSRFQDLLSPKKPKKPYAFVFGHGLWNDLDIQASLNWLDGILARTLEKAPYLNPAGRYKRAHPPLWPRLYITPNSAGVRKPDNWLVSQGDKALMVFEESMKFEAAKRNVETLGTWNMSIQASKYDGVHLDLKGNLVKAMGVVNWLNLVEMRDW